MARRIRIRRDTAANWVSVDPVLGLGEPGLDTTNNILKFGDGTSTWSALDAFSSGGDVSDLSDVARPFNVTGIVDGNVTISTLEAAMTGFPTGSLWLLGTHHVIVYPDSSVASIGLGGTVTGGSGPGLYEWDGTNLTIVPGRLAEAQSRRDILFVGANVYDENLSVLYESQAPPLIGTLLDIDFGSGLSSTFASTVPYTLAVESHVHDDSDVNLTGTYTGNLNTATPPSTLDEALAVIDDLALSDSYKPMVLGTWVVDTSSTASSTSTGELRFNNATQTSATSIYLNHVDSAGNEIDNYMEMLASSNYLLIQKSNAITSYQRWLATGFSAMGGSTYGTSVTFDASSGTLVDGDVVDVIVIPDLSGVGSGNVVGPASATDSGPVLFDGTTGKLLKGGSVPASAVSIDASGFNGNLTTSDDTLQEVAQKVDDLSLGDTSDPVWDLDINSYISQPGPYSSYSGYNSTVGMVTWTAQFVPAGTYDRLGINVATSGDCTLRLCIDSVGADGRPETLLLDAGTINTSSGTGLLEATINWVNAVDQWVWIRITTTAAASATTLTVLSGLAGNSWPPWHGWPTSTNASRSMCGVRTTGHPTGVDEQPDISLMSANSVASPRTWLRRSA